MAEHRHPAIFLDRDGTIIEDRGYLSTPTEVSWIPGTLEALRALQEHFVLFMVTNQSGVAKGLITLQQVNTVNSYVVATLAQAGVQLADVYVCPHNRADACECIKPKPHFLRRAEREFSVDLGRSYTVGDHPHDVQFAQSVGATGIYVLTGHGEKHRGELLGTEIILPSIAELPSAIASMRGPHGH